VSDIPLTILKLLRSLLTAKRQTLLNQDLVVFQSRSNEQKNGSRLEGLIYETATGPHY
jgi:hypothetical protein